jgi:hypothetical protein
LGQLLSGHYLDVLGGAVFHLAIYRIFALWVSEDFPSGIQSLSVPIKTRYLYWRLTGRLEMHLVRLVVHDISVGGDDVLARVNPIYGAPLVS